MTDNLSIVASVEEWLRGHDITADRPTRGQAADALAQLSAELRIAKSLLLRCLSVSQGYDSSKEITLQKEIEVFLNGVS